MNRHVLPEIRNRHDDDALAELEWSDIGRSKRITTARGFILAAIIGAAMWGLIWVAYAWGPGWVR